MYDQIFYGHFAGRPQGAGAARHLTPDRYATAQKCPQNAGNAVSETQQTGSGGHAPRPPYNCVATMTSPH